MQAVAAKETKIMDLDELTEDQRADLDRLLKIIGFSRSNRSNSSNSSSHFNSAKDSCNSPHDKAESSYTNKMVQAA